MFCSVMMDWIFGYAESSLIIAKELDWTFDDDLEVVENSLQPDAFTYSTC